MNRGPSGTPVIQFAIGLIILVVLAIWLPRKIGVPLFALVLLGALALHPQAFTGLVKGIQDFGKGMEGL